jgi:hypothetical protein
MARLLLCSARMKVWALLPLLASSGCLFLDGINQPPTVSLDAGLSGTASAIKGAAISLRYSISDDEANHETLVPQFDVEDAVTGDHLDPTCDYDGVTTATSYDIRFYIPGTFLVTATTRDRHGAQSNTSSVMVTISDAPPVFTSDAMVVPTSRRDWCNLNAAGDVITLALKGQVSDLDSTATSGYLGCAAGETLTYTWRISAQPSGTKPVLTLYDGTACASPTAASGVTVVAPDATTQVCLWTDPMIVGATAMYSVALDVSDGTTTATSPVGDVPVGVDQPPCITGTDPIAGSYVVDRTQLQQFIVDGVADDRDVFGSSGISYAWSVWRESDPIWRAVPSWTMSTYQLDVSSYGVGEQVRVRVEAMDRTGTLASAAICPVDADDCIVTSCASSPNACHKWKTWDLELR